MATQFFIDTSDLKRLTDRLQQWAKRPGFASLYAGIGAELESQTRRRIEDERRSPEGVPWPDWSPAYAATRHGGHDLLQNEGDLLDSLHVVVDSQGVAMGTNLVYGAIHQFGGAPVGINIPKRPYLGISDANAEDLDAVVDDWLEGVFRRLQS